MNEQKGKKILLPRSKDRAEQQNFPEQVSQKRGIVEIDETATDIENMVGFLQYKKESIFNKCFKINEKLLEIEEIVDVLTDIGINPAIARFRGEKYTEGSDFKIMKVIHFEDSEPIGYNYLLSDWLKEITDDECPEIPPDFLGFDVVFPEIDMKDIIKKNLNLMVLMMVLTMVLMMVLTMVLTMVMTMVLTMVLKILVTM